MNSSLSTGAAATEVPDLTKSLNVLFNIIPCVSTAIWSILQPCPGIARIGVPPTKSAMAGRRDIANVQREMRQFCLKICLTQEGACSGGKGTPERWRVVHQRPPDFGRAGHRSSKQAKRRRDILKDEESLGHLSAEAVRIGRMIEAVLEWRGSGLGSRSQWHTRIDNSTSPHLHAIQLDRTAATYEQWLQQQVGRLGIAFLKNILFERMSYAETAAQMVTLEREVRAM